MKKIILPCLLLLLVHLTAQGQLAHSYEQYETVFGRIDQTISDFVTASSLRERREVSAASRQRFNALFAPGALLDDDLCAACQQAVVRSKPVDDFVSGLLQDYPKGLESVRLLQAAVDYAALDEGTVQAYLQRSIAAVSVSKKPVAVTDLVRLTLKVDWTSLEVKIVSVSWMGTGTEPATAVVPVPVSTPLALPGGVALQTRPAQSRASARIDVVAPPLEIPVLLAPASPQSLIGPVFSATGNTASPPQPAAATTLPAPRRSAPVAKSAAQTLVPNVAPLTALGEMPPLPAPAPSPSLLALETAPPILMWPGAQPMPQLAAPPEPVSTTALTTGYEPVPAETPVPVAAALGAPAPNAQPTATIPPAPPQPTHRASAWNDPVRVGRLFAAVHLRGGTLSGRPATGNLFAGYDGRIAARSRGGNLRLDGGSNFGVDVELSYFFGKKAQFGLGTGLLYLRRNARLTLDEFAVDYRSTDRNGNAFRQRITAQGPVREQFTTQSLSVPVLLKGRFPLSDRLSITADAGVLLHLQVNSRYSTTAVFDYEAFYLFDANGKAVYDMGDEPSSESWMISRSNYEAHGKEGQNAEEYFNSFAGYNVGINKKPAKASGSNSLESVSLGLLVQPGLEYRIGSRLRATAALYYLSQAFRSSTSGQPYRITDAVGSYSSLGSALGSTRLHSAGLSVGLQFALL